MKKVFLSVVTMSLVLFSCNKDETTTPEPVATVTPSQAKLFTSSNTTGKVSITDCSGATPVVKSFTVSSMDADGIYFDPATNVLVQASRTNNRLEAYNNVTTAFANNAASLTLACTSNMDFNNARELTVFGDKFVVAQDQSTANGNQSKLIVYQRVNGAFNLLKTFTVNFKLWGIKLQGSTLYAVADLTGDLCSFDNLCTNSSGAIMPTKRVTIQGLTRTHGLAYCQTDNLMILSDVGSATSDTDGGLVILKNFDSLYAATPNGGTISTTNQIRVYGTNSKLGNPVDVAYDQKNKCIFVAERLNQGGQLLRFSTPTTSGDFAPQASRPEPGVTAVFFCRKG